MRRGYRCLWTKVCPDNQSDGIFLVEGTVGIIQEFFSEAEAIFCASETSFLHYGEYRRQLAN
jgi:hypothetical protein